MHSSSKPFLMELVLVLKAQVSRLKSRVGRADRKGIEITRHRWESEMLGVLLITGLVLALLVVLPRFELRPELVVEYAIDGVGVGLIIALIVVATLWAGGAI